MSFCLGTGSPGVPSRPRPREHRSKEFLGPPQPLIRQDNRLRLVDRISNQPLLVQPPQAFPVKAFPSPPLIMQRQPHQAQNSVVDPVSLNLHAASLSQIIAATAAQTGRLRLFGGLVDGQRELALPGKAPPRRQLLRRDPVPARHVHHARSGLEGFQDDPRLHLVGPRPPPQSAPPTPPAVRCCSRPRPTKAAHFLEKLTSHPSPNHGRMDQVRLALGRQGTEPPLTI